MDGRDRILRNPFYVLELAPGCGRAEVERQGQKLLGILELGLSAALVYRTPVGTAERTAEGVRQAMAELRDPERRLMHELWAHLPAEADGTHDDVRNENDEHTHAHEDEHVHEDDPLAPWTGALRALGFGAPGGA